MSMVGPNEILPPRNTRRLPYIDENSVFSVRPEKTLLFVQEHRNRRYDGSARMRYQDYLIQIHKTEDTSDGLFLILVSVSGGTSGNLGHSGGISVGDRNLFLDGLDGSDRGIGIN